MDHAYTSAPNGNVVQTGRTKLDGVRKRHLTLALGFGGNAAAARSTARAALDRGFGRAARRYADGWHRYLGSLKARPRSARSFATTYDVSVMTLAAHEDKTFRGASSPRRRCRGCGARASPSPSDAYHLVWSRDLYQIATALLAAGDRAGAMRALAVPVRPPAEEGRRLLPAELDRRRAAEMDEPAARRGRVPDRARVAARPPRRPDLRARQERGRVPARQRPAQPAGALGEPGRLLAGHDRLGDRRARDRRRPREGQPRRREREDVAGDRRRLAVQGRRLDRDEDRPLLVPALLPAPQQDRRPECGHEVQPRRLRPRAGRRAQDHRPELPRARAPRRQARELPARAQHARRGRQAARRRHAQRALLAPLRLRRLRREEGRLELGHRPAREPDRGLGEQRDHRPHLADLRGRARRVRAAERRPRVGARAPRLDRRHRRARPHDRRAGVGPVPALRLRGLPARRGHALRPAAGVVARPARAARVVGRGRAAGRAAGDRREAVRRGG